MAVPSLALLPRELLRQICGNLPCQSALDFLLVCRSIYRDCNDWTVWRAIAQQDLENNSSITIPDAGELDRWKRYVVAATKVPRSPEHWKVKDLRDWIPQLAALAYSGILQEGHLSSFRKLHRSVFHGDALLYDAEPALFLNNMSMDEHSLETWTLAQTAAFSLSMCYLSLPVCVEPFDKLLQAVPWTRINNADASRLSTTNQAKRASMQHTFANQFVGLFRAKLRLLHAPSSGPGLYEPPSAFTIPCSRLMELPPPFTLNSPVIFTHCHLPVMTNPSFFTEGEWTGYMCICGNAYGAEYNGVGGRHHDGFDHSAGGGRPAPPGEFPYGRSFEGVVRFDLVDSDSDDHFKLQSNNFHSQAMLHNIRVTVYKRTGQLSIHHWNPLISNSMTTEGVITPFGIVTYLKQPGMWMWLWKAEWSPSHKEAYARRS